MRSMTLRRWLATVMAVASIATSATFANVDAAEDELPKTDDSDEVQNDGVESTAPDEAGGGTVPDQIFDLPSGQWAGTVAFTGSRHASGLSAVGQPTEITEQVDSSSIEIVAQIGEGDRAGYIESGTATVSIGHSEIGTFASSVTSETGVLDVAGDLARFELSGTLTRDLSAWDADGVFIEQVSYATEIDVTWTFDLVDAECGLLEYELTDAKGNSLLYWATTPNETSVRSFDYTHDLSVGALLGTHWEGPSVMALQNSLDEMEILVGGMVRNPDVQQADELLQQIRDIEQLYTQYIESGRCLDSSLVALVAESMSTIRQLVLDVIGVLLQMDSIETDLLLTVFEIAVSVGAVVPEQGGPGQDLLDMTEQAVQGELADAIEDQDLALIIDIMVWAKQYGFDQIVDDAQEAIDLGVGQ